MSDIGSQRKKFFLGGLVVTVVFCSLILLCVPPEPKNTAVTAPLQSDQANGSAPLIVTTVDPNASASDLYQRFCSGCHGAKGDADTPTARMMTVKPPNLVTGPFKYGRTSADITSLILNGGGVMPGFGRELSEEKARGIAEFVLSLEKKGNP